MREGWINGVKTILLPDRNIVSRLAQAAKGEPLDDHRRRAAAVLAFAQCLDILIEPAISFHELAPKQGNDAAHGELAWFRVADNGSAYHWIAAALRQVDQIPSIGTPLPIVPLDLAKPLSRWRRNYVVALKIGELELSDSSPMERILSLFQWMYQDFILAGPAAMLACVYFARNSPGRRGLLKNLRVHNREKAIEGAQNAAWDVTHLSDFVRRVNAEPHDPPQRFILATFDAGLRAIARLAVDINANETDASNLDCLALALQQWWPVSDARRIAETWFDYIGRTRDPDWWRQYENRSDYVGELIARGEAALRNWSNPSRT
jgi:hypothetical protein